MAIGTSQGEDHRSATCVQISDEELWEIFKENSNSKFFDSVRSVLILPAPDPLPKLTGRKSIGRPIPGGEELNKHLGILIAVNASNFEPTGISEKYNGYRFNPTELSAYYVSLHLNYIRDVLCGKSGVDAGTSVNTALVKRFAGVIAVGLVAVSQQIALALAALMLLTTLRATRHSLCTMTNKAVIDAIIDPESCFERAPDGHWKTKDGMAPSKRAYRILIAICIVTAILAAYLILGIV